MYKSGEAIPTSKVVESEVASGLYIIAQLPMAIKNSAGQAKKTLEKKQEKKSNATVHKSP